jgi:CRP/FNR family transcriptional regulator, cyclic AMP receptor protein
MILKVKCKNCPVSNCLIQYCSPSWQTTIDSQKGQIRYKKGQYIIIEGSPVYGIFFINQGKVKVVSNGFNDRLQIVRLANNGHLLGHRGYGGEIYPISAIAIEDSNICFVDNDTLYKAFMANPKFTFEMMMFYSRELRKTEIRIKYLAQMTVREKVAEAILFIKDSFESENNKKIVNDIILTREEIAGIAGTNTEQVSRFISEFKNSNILETEGKKIIIKDEKKLRKMIENYESSFKQFQKQR